VLENYHAASAFKVASKPGCNVLKWLNPESRRRVRSLVIAMVLATDVSRHIGLISKINGASKAASAAAVVVHSSGGGGSSSSEPSGGGGHTKPQARNFDVVLALSTLVVLGDIGHVSKRFDLHQGWTHRITEEFYRQGDVERAQKMAVSPLCDRLTGNLARSQIGFFQYLILPLYRCADADGRSVGAAPACCYGFIDTFGRLCVPVRACDRQSCCRCP
jgi:hypothetical protein